MQVLHGAVHVATIAVLAGLTALATDKIHKEYVTRKVISPVIKLFFLTKVHRACTPTLASLYCVVICGLETILPQEITMHVHASALSEGACVLKQQPHLYLDWKKVRLQGHTHRGQGHTHHGQDGPVKPLSDRGLLGRKV